MLDSFDWVNQDQIKVTWFFFKADMGMMYG